jgi:hypothetical protein
MSIHQSAIDIELCPVCDLKLVSSKDYNIERGCHDYHKTCPISEVDRGSMNHPIHFVIYQTATTTKILISIRLGEALFNYDTENSCLVVWKNSSERMNFLDASRKWAIDLHSGVGVSEDDKPDDGGIIMNFKCIEDLYSFAMQNVIFQ